MNCYVCAECGEERPAVGLCRHCLVGLCLVHLREAQRPLPIGLQFGCRHVEPGPTLERRAGSPRGVVQAARR